MKLKILVISLLLSFNAFGEPLMVNEKQLNDSFAIDYIEYSSGKREIQYLAKQDIPDDSSNVQLDCADKTAAKLHDFNSIWLWNTGKIVANPHKAIAVAQDLGVKSIYIQLPKEIDDISKFVELANLNGIKVTALSGEPDYIYNWNGIDKDISRIKDFNNTHEYKITGIQYDIEPHTLNSFSINKEKITQLYIKTLNYINKQKGNLTFSAVVPFWYANLKVNNRNLLGDVLKNVDYITTMSYRTNYDQIISITNNALCLAAESNKKVQIGIEHLHLDNERHYTILKDSVTKLIQNRDEKYLYDSDIDSLIKNRYVQTYDVKSSNISFRGDESGLRNILTIHPEYLSFKGWAINGVVFDDI